MTQPEHASPTFHMPTRWAQQLFGQISEKSLARVLATAERIKLARGEHLFDAGDEANALYVLLRGKIKLTRRYSESDPRRESLLTVLGDESVFGELSVLDPGPRTTTCVAISNCELLEIHRDAFHQLLVKEPSLALSLLHQLARRLRHATDYASDLVLNDVHGRTARTLLYLTELFGEPSTEGISVPHGLTQQEIAHMVGASRESVNKYLMELTDHGWISLGYRSFVLIDQQAVTDQAEHLNPNSLPRD